MDKSVTTLSTEGFNVLVAQVKRVGKMLNATVQRAAVFAIYKSIVDRNSTPANTLYQAMPSGTRRQALVTFLERNGNLCYSTVSKRIEFFDVLDLTGIPRPEFDEKKLMAFPWHTSVKEADITSAWDVRDELDRILSKLERAHDNSTREVINPELIRQVRIVMAKFASEQYESEQSA